MTLYKIFRAMHISQGSRYTQYEARESFWLQKDLCPINTAPRTLHMQQDQPCAQNFLHALVWVLPRDFEIRLYFLVNILLRGKKKKVTFNQRSSSSVTV